MQVNRITQMKKLQVFSQKKNAKRSGKRFLLQAPRNDKRVTFCRRIVIRFVFFEQGLIMILSRSSNSEKLLLLR